MRLVTKISTTLAAAAILAGGLQLLQPTAVSASDCTDRCARFAREKLANCIERGGSEARCHRYARRVYRRCTSNCD